MRAEGKQLLTSSRQLYSIEGLRHRPEVDIIFFKTFGLCHICTPYDLLVIMTSDRGSTALPGKRRPSCRRAHRAGALWRRDRPARNRESIARVATGSGGVGAAALFYADRTRANRIQYATHLESAEAY